MKPDTKHNTGLNGSGASVSLSANRSEVDHNNIPIEQPRWTIDAVRAEVSTIAKLFDSEQLDNLGVLANVEELARKSGWVTTAERRALKADAEAEIKKLRIERKQKSPSISMTAAAEFTEEEMRRAAELSKSSDLCKCWHETIEKSGYPVQPRISMSIQFAFTARLLAHSTMHVFYGVSSSGKSAIVIGALRLLPTDSYLLLTSMSKLALYQLGDLKGKIVVLGEIKPQRPGEDDEAQMAIRQLISEGKVTRLVTERETGRNVMRVHTTEGPCSVIASTTQDPQAFNQEFGNRNSWISSDDSAATTSKVQDAIIDDMLGKKPPDDLELEIRAWQAFNHSLKALPVVIPFARLIKLNNEQVEARRLIKLLRDHICIAALLHQNSRDRITLSDGQECVVATADDYRVAVHLLNFNGPRTLDLCSGRAKKAFDSAKASLAAFTDFFTLNDLVSILKKPRATVQGYLWQWVEVGLVKELDEKHKKQKKYRYVSDAAFTEQDLGIVPYNSIDWSKVDWSCSEVTAKVPGVAEK